MTGTLESHDKVKRHGTEIILSQILVKKKDYTREVKILLLVLNFNLIPKGEIYLINLFSKFVDIKIIHSLLKV